MKRLIRRTCLLLLVLLFTLLPSIPQHIWAQDVSYFALMPKAFQSTTEIYPSAIYYNGKTYVVWAGDTATHIRAPFIDVYDHTTQTWYGAVCIHDDTYNDHGQPAITIDNLGYIHVAYGCHGNRMRYSISTNPEDISTWIVRDNISAGATYPRWVWAGANLYMFYRPIDVTKLCYRYSSDNGATWSVETIVIDFGYGGIFYCYAENIEYDPVNGRFNIPFYTYSVGGGNHNIYFCYYKLSDGTIHNMANDWFQNAPASKANSDAHLKLVDSLSNNRLAYAPTLHLDSNNYPHIIYAYGVETGLAPAHVSHHHIWWNGSAWTDETILTTSSDRACADFVINSLNSIDAYFIDAEGSLVCGQIKKYHWNGSVWSSLGTVFSQSEQGRPYLLGYPKMVWNHTDDVQWVMTEGEITGQNAVYAFNSQDIPVISNPVVPSEITETTLNYSNATIKYSVNSATNSLISIELNSASANITLNLK